MRCEGQSNNDVYFVGLTPFNQSVLEITRMMVCTKKCQLERDICAVTTLQVATGREVKGASVARCFQ